MSIAELKDKLKYTVETLSATEIEDLINHAESFKNRKQKDAELMQMAMEVMNDKHELLTKLAK
jgi:hypothetical protein